MKGRTCFPSSPLAIFLAASVTLSSCRPTMRPERATIPDGQNARYFTDSAFECKMADTGYDGWRQVLAMIEARPRPAALGVCLKSLAGFHETYRRIGPPCRHRLDCVLRIVHRLLQSGDRDEVRVALTYLYYDFNVYDDHTAAIVRALEHSEDPYIRRFASLCSRKIGVETGRIPPLSAWSQKTTVEASQQSSNAAAHGRVAPFGQ